MNYLYFKSDKGNFGDDLNPWLWPRIFDANKNFNDNYFLGIGSILHDDNHNLNKIADKRKIVFGTGIRPSNTFKNFNIDDTWDIKFLRGPLSSKHLGDSYQYISDAAYAVRHLKFFPEMQRTEKKYEVSLMPYFHSTDYFNWEKIANNLGYHLISPHSEQGVEHTIREIAASKYLISEAMHGAILADIMRVPWHRFVLTTPYTEGARISEFKWNDWLNSLDIYKSDASFIPFYQNTRLHKPIKKLSMDLLSISFLRKSKVIEKLSKTLSDNLDFSLSHDSVIQTIDAKIYEEIQKL